MPHTVPLLSHYDLQQSNDFIKHLPNASFVSLDEEMTGIMLPPGMAGRPSKDDMPSDRYPAFKRIPERYSMIQLGICLFEAQPQDEAQPSSTNNSNFLVVRRFVYRYICVASFLLDMHVSHHPTASFRDVIILRSFHPPTPALREKSC